VLALPALLLLLHPDPAAATEPAWPGTGPDGAREPGWRDGVGIQVNHVRSGSEAAHRFGLGGNTPVARAMGGF
jgi:hypothetical protein